jgi:membrane protein implicated in regulation of membrane protease activity
MGVVTLTVIWLIAGIAMLGAEVLTGTFVLLMFGGGALVAAGASALLGASLPVSALVFAVVSVLLLGGARPALRRRTHVELESTDNSPVGAYGLVVRRVDEVSGKIKIDGELWSARSLEHSRVFEPGEWVTVMRLSGVTAMVGSML